MHRLQGKQNNTAKYYYDGYIYYIDKRGDGTILRCARRNAAGCKATIYLEHVNRLMNDQHTVVNGHNHEADHLTLLKERFTAELEERASDPQEDLIRIFNNVLQKDE